MTSGDILTVLEECCERQAKLFLDCPPGKVEEDAQRTSARPYAVDARTWRTEHGNDDPAGWLGQAVVNYLAEASHQLMALGYLIRLKAVHATLDPLIRAIVERCGRICWLLDSDSTASQRSARTQLEIGVCAHHYAETLSLLASADDTRERLRAWRGEHRARVHNRYTVETNGEKKDMSAWSVDGETYPGYTELAVYALNKHSLSAGVYAGLSGFSHPNLFFARERQQRTVSTRNVMIMHTDSIERDLRFAIGSHSYALKHWAAYFLDQALADAVVDAADRLADVLDESSVLPDIAATEET